MVAGESLLIKNGTVITRISGKKIFKGNIYIEDNIIREIGSKKFSADNIIDATGKIVIPSLINAHSHMYGAYARGMSLKGEPPQNFIQILKKLWWMLDKKLTTKDIRLCTDISAIEALKSGTTVIAEHHSSPYAVSGCLEIISREWEKAGITGSICYEVSDRDGEDIARKGIDENISFIKKHAGHQRIKGMFGLHASFTLGDETLARCVEAEAGHDVGFHLHVAEDKADNEKTQGFTGKRVVERLIDAGVLKKGTIAAHCIYIEESEIRLLQESGAFVVHNPESNMNNAVGVAPVEDMLRSGIVVGIGTDGMSFDMFAQARAVYLLHKLNSQSPLAMPADMVIHMLFEHNRQIVCPNTGAIEAGRFADIVILDYIPPTPLTADNFPWHFIFGITKANVETVISDGNIVVEDKALKTLNEDEIMNKARKSAQELWDKL